MSGSDGVRDMRPRTAKQRRNDAQLKKQLLIKCNGLCMRCGQRPDWRGLSLHHKDNKGMGGTTKIYTIDEVELICAECHALSHNIHEVKG